MRLSFLLIMFFIFNTNAIAQEVSNPEVGDKLIISKSSEFGYKYLELPNANFILKKNGRLNYDQLIGNSVIVEKVKNNKSGTTVVLRRADGKKFFGSFPEIKADYSEAIKAGELKTS